MIENIEHSMMQIENKYANYSSHFVFKGITEHLNYIPYNESIIDLRFGAPFKFFKGLKLPVYLNSNRNERIVSKNT